MLIGKKAMQEEYNALIHNNIWSFFPIDSSCNVVDCKWLFKIKCKADGSIDRYKAHSVAKGFTQCPGFDYKEILSPVIKPTTIPLVLTIAV